MLIDDIIRNCCLFGSHGKKLEKYLVDAIRFQVDNVSHYVYDNIDQDNPVWKSLHKHIPNIAPLSPIMWFEYSGQSILGNSIKDCGVLLTIDYDSTSGKGSNYYEKIELSDTVRWVLRAETFVRTKDEAGVCRWIYLIGVGKDGQFVNTAGYPSQWLYCPDIPRSDLSDEFVPNKLYVEIIVALTAICFAHCKGAEVKEHQPSRQVRRHAERKGQTVYTHRTIDIGPASRVLSGEGNISQNGLGKALHICRGHFAHYTADKPLFGKYVGTVYKPMHLRGKADNGVVEKDYRVHAEAK